MKDTSGGMGKFSLWQIIVVCIFALVGLKMVEKFVLK